MISRFRIPTAAYGVVESREAIQYQACCDPVRQGPGANMHNGRRQARVVSHCDQKAVQYGDVRRWMNASTTGRRCFHVPVAGDRRSLTLPSHSPKHGPLLVVCHEVSDSSPRVEETPPSQRPHRILTSADVDTSRSMIWQGETRRNKRQDGALCKAVCVYLDGRRRRDSGRKKGIDPLPSKVVRPRSPRSA